MNTHAIVMKYYSEKYTESLLEVVGCLNNELRNMIHVGYFIRCGVLVDSTSMWTILYVEAGCGFIVVDCGDVCCGLWLWSFHNIPPIIR
jgi:hypothetical protein